MKLGLAGDTMLGRKAAERLAKVPPLPTGKLSVELLAIGPLFSGARAAQQGRSG